MYAVKEIFYTLQGEGYQTGRPAVFCRFAGCNLWTGSHSSRTSSICDFCDTDFVGVNGPRGGRFATGEALAEAVINAWPANVSGRPLVVCTGGEPMLQLDEQLVHALHWQGLEVAIETNGTLPVTAGVDWICVSPKSAAPLQQTSGDELKLVYPQAKALPEQFRELDFNHFYLQPMDLSVIVGRIGALDTVRQTVDYCLRHPQWRLSLQTHKMIGIA
jgi:7-carboxy-7-deazaguanine synthase